VDGGNRGFAAIVDEVLFRPLGMTQSSLGPRPDLLARLCPVVARYDEPGLFEPRGLEGLGQLVQVPGCELPAGGFLTTAVDAQRFVRMLAQGGELDGARILSPAMLALCAQNHTGERPNGLWDYTRALRGWLPWPAFIGLGFFVRGTGITPGPFGNLNAPCAFGGFGAGSTGFWIDARSGLSFCLLSTGLMEDSHHIQRLQCLSDLAIAALVD
jgi:CubicO group peptidase (beta-lactamase class C family)